MRSDVVELHREKKDFDDMIMQKEALVKERDEEVMRLEIQLGQAEQAFDDRDATVTLLEQKNKDLEESAGQVRKLYEEKVTELQMIRKSNILVRASVRMDDPSFST